MEEENKLYMQSFDLTKSKNFYWTTCITFNYKISEMYLLI